MFVTGPLVSAFTGSLGSSRRTHFEPMGKMFFEALMQCPMRSSER